MIVDDDSTIIFTVKAGLDDLASGYEIISANSGKECFDLLNKGEMPDLILLDIMMPEMNGWQVQQELRGNQKWWKIPLIFLTAKNDKASKRIGSMAGYDYIEKPFDIIDLKKRIDNAIDS